MKKVNKKIIILLITILAVVTLANNAYASSFKFNVNASKTRLKPGESTIVTMKISDIVDDNNLGINAVESTLSYDTNVLEVVTSNEMKGKNNWTITYNAKRGNFLASNIISGVKETQEIGEINFKVKNTAKKGKTIIKFSKVKSNDGKNLIPESDKQIELIIEDTDGKTGGIEQKNTGAEENGKGTKTIKSDVSTSKIPAAGKSIKVLEVLGIVLIFSIIIYIKYNKIDK